MSEMRFMLPENLDIDEVVRKNSGAFYGNNLKKEKLVFICDALVNSRAQHRKQLNEHEKRFVPLSTQILQEVIHDYEKYLDFLLDSGIFFSENHYIPGKKCKGYCFNPFYDGQKLKQIVVDSYTLKKARRRSLEIQNRRAKKETWGYGYLTKWWDSDKLKLDLGLAFDWLGENENEKIQFIKEDSKKEKEKRIKRAIDTTQDSKLLASAINNRKAHYSFSGEGHRFYNPITNLKRELRNFLTYDGEPLVEVDKKNSQPFLATVLFKSSFWEISGEKKSENLKLEKISKEISKKVRSSKKYKEIIMLLKSSENLAHKDNPFQKFIELVVSGEFYEYIQEHLSPLYPTRFNTRTKVKTGLLTIFYLSNQKAPYNKPSQTFREHFPEVYQLFKLIKSIQSNYLPIILQRIESFLILDVVCKKISVLFPHIPLFTIHDSIITTKGNEAIVEEIMAREIQNWTGHKASFGRKDLLPMQLAT